MSDAFSLIPRRTFLRSATLLAAAGSLIPSALLAAGSGPDRSRVVQIPLSEWDKSVVDFALSYGSEVRLVGVSVRARLNGKTGTTTQLLVKVSSLEEMTVALTEQRIFTSAYATGNVLSVTLAEEEYTIENLLPEAFEARLAALGKLRNLAFGHDALTFDPAKSLLTDPFSAASRELMLVNRTLSGTGALEAILRGLVEAHQAGLSLGLPFVNWKTRILSRLSSKSVAKVAVSTLIPRLAEVAETIPVAGFKALLLSRLISSALKTYLGISVADAIARFDEMRGTLGAAYNDSSIWLSVLAPSQVVSDDSEGSALSLIQRGTRFQVIRSQKALRGAKALVNHPAFLPI